MSEWSPAARVVVVVAEPSETVTGLPRGVVASVNCTVPGAVGGVIVTVSVSVVVESADEAGVASSVMVVVVASLTEGLLTG